MTRFNDLTFTQQTSKEDRFNVLADEIDANVAGDSTISGRVSDLETAVGSATGEDAGGLAKDVADLQTVVGEATGEDAGGIAKDVADVKAAIGSEETEGSILARIYALEHPE